MLPQRHEERSIWRLSLSHGETLAVREAALQVDGRGEETR